MARDSGSGNNDFARGLDNGKRLGFAFELIVDLLRIFRMAENRPGVIDGIIAWLTFDFHSPSRHACPCRRRPNLDRSRIL